MFEDYDIALVRTPEDFELVRPRFEAAHLIGFDMETAGLKDLTVWGLPMAIPPHGLSKGLAVYIACEKSDDPELNCELDFDYHIKPWLEWMCENPEREWVGHNLKFDCKVQRTNRMRHITKNVFDTMIASWMLTNHERRQSLDVVAKRELGIDVDKDLMDIRLLRTPNSEKTKKQVEEFPYDPKLYWIEMLRYGKYDGVVPLLLRDKFIPRLHSFGLKRAAKELEFPCIHVTTEMEMRGVLIDVDHLKGLETRLASEKDRAERDCYDLMGKEININSPQQLSALLFDDPDGVGLKPKPWMQRGKGRTLKSGEVKQGSWPTGEPIMKAYSHPVCEKILDFRGLSKLLGTYVKPLIQYAGESPDGRVRTHWNQTGTATGRYSSSDPINMQNAPREEGLIRKSFTASPGFTLVACDYSQIELRLMAHQSGDPELVRCYRSDIDVHALTASQAAGVPIGDVTKGQRQLAKAINFGFLYGMSAKRFVDYAKNSYGVVVTLAEAELFRETYFKTYKGIVGYHDYMREEILEKGYTTNFIGERRYLPDHKSTDPENGGYFRWKAWSEGVNHTIQGSAAALIKIAMLNIHNELYRPFGDRISDRYGRIVTLWKSKNNMAHEVRLMMQVHDEVVFEVRNEIVDKFAPWLQKTMETAATGFLVPIVAEYGIGPTYEDAK